VRAKINIPPIRPYPKRAVEQGLQRIGLREATGHECGADLLVTWSPWYGTYREAEARRHRVVIVVENGWFSPLECGRLYQVSLWGWNGQGNENAEPADLARVLSWGPPLQRRLCANHGPWLVVASRGGGDDPRAMPRDWPERTAARLSHVLAAKGTAPQVLIHHKGGDEPITDVFERLKPCAVVTWTSSAASWALWHEIPVFYCGPAISTWRVARRWQEDMAAPLRYQVDSGRIRDEFARMAWTQWSEDELRSGVPFARLLNMAELRACA
jgi:hypothetical protein